MSDRKLGRNKAGRLRRWLGSLLLLSVVAAVCLLAGEVVVRALYADNMVVFPRYHTDADYGEYTLRRMRPNSVFWHSGPDGRWKFVINEQGFRDTEDYRYEKPDGLFRIISLGDSHTQGYEVRQNKTFSEILERALRARGVDAEVLNTGVSGFSTAEQLAFLEAEGIKYRPDAVVLGFYANDFDDNVKAGLFRLDGEVLVADKTRHIPGVAVLNIINAIPPFRWLSENSRLYSLALNTAWFTAKELLLEAREAELQTEFAVHSGEVSAYKKRLASRLVQRISAFCRAEGIAFIILDIPGMADRAGYDFAPSIPDELIPAFRAASDALLLSEDVLGDFRGLAESHVPNGHQHISEFSHLMFGLAAATAVLPEATADLRSAD